MNARPAYPNLSSIIYPGIHADQDTGMTEFGRVVRDAWVFGLIPEEESCAGWNYAQIQTLSEKVHTAWHPYHHLPSLLPKELRARHMRIHNEAIARARKSGWDAELPDDDH